jgi:hypothetical protein
MMYLTEKVVATVGERHPEYRCAETELKNSRMRRAAGPEGEQYNDPATICTSRRRSGQANARL